MMAQKKTPPARETKKKYHIEMTSLSLFFWVFGLCFLLTWVFVLGVLVGRGFLPSAVSTITDLKAQVTKLQGLVSHGKAVNPAPHKAADSDPKLAFYEKLSGKKEDVKKKGLLEERSDPPRPDGVHARPETLPKGSPEARKPEIQGGAAVPSPESPQFTVQLVALEDRGKAESTIRQLREKGFDAYSYEVKVKGKTYYRVRCGKFRTREDAALQAKKLMDQVGMNGFVTKID
ncbi:MAG: SPOR domain-containing protein [Thermodesulfobacteriota bacterium]